MKARKILGNLLAGLGGVLFFIGLIALLLPKTQNQQLQLLLNSFRTPTDNILLQWMNNGMNGAMDHCVQVIIFGLVLTALGLLLIFSVRTTTAAKPVQRMRQPVHAVPVTVPAQPNPFARNQMPAEEANPFARYIAPDVLPKSTAVRSAEPAAMLAEEAPAGSDEELLYGLVDDEDDDTDTAIYYPLQPDDSSDDDDDDDDVDVDDDDANEVEEAVLPTAEVPAEEVSADESFAEELPAADPVAEPEFFAPVTDESLEPAAEDAAAEPDSLEEASTEEAPAEALPAEVPVAEPEPLEPVIPEDLEPAAEAAAAGPVEEASMEEIPAEEPAVEEPEQQTTPAPTGLRPAIRSTFRKSTADPSAASQPVSRIKSTMGHKR